MNQTFTDFELIFVDNGSSDGSSELALELCKENEGQIKLVEEHQKGIPFARNKGLELAKGEYVTFLDIDDEFTNNKIKTLYDLILKHPNAGMAFGQTLRIYTDTKREEIQATGKVLSGVNNPPSLAFNWIKSFYHLPQTGASLIKTSVAKEIGGFPIDLLLGNDDVGFHLKIALRYPIVYHPFVAVKYYRHTKSEGARLNETNSAYYRYFDANNTFSNIEGRKYYEKTGDIRFWGYAQRGLFSNYVQCRFKNKIDSDLTLKEPFFWFYKYILIYYHLLPFKLATLKFKVIRRIVNLINPKKYPLN